jgi:hypothetical protein
MVADEMGQQGESGGIVADSILTAGIFVLLSVLDDQALAVARLRDLADWIDQQ